MVPSSGLPARRRTSAGSIPCTMALLTRWISGSLSRSSTALSSGVSPPVWTSCTRLPAAAAVSRTRRGNRPNTVEIGSSRVSIRVDSSRFSVFSSASTVWSSRSSSGQAPGPPGQAAVCFRQRRVLDQALAQHLEQRVETAEVDPHHAVDLLGAGAAAPRRSAWRRSGWRARHGHGVGPARSSAAPARRRRPRRRDPAPPSAWRTRSTSSPPPATSRADASSVRRSGLRRRSPHASSSAWATSCIGVRPIIAELPLTVCSGPGSAARRSSAGSPSPPATLELDERVRHLLGQRQALERRSPAAAPRRGSRRRSRQAAGAPRSITRATRRSTSAGWNGFRR